MNGSRASKRQISRLVSTYGRFQGNLFETVEIVTSNMFLKMVISQLDSDLKLR